MLGKVVLHLLAVLTGIGAALLMNGKSHGTETTADAAAPKATARPAPMDAASLVDAVAAKRLEEQKRAEAESYPTIYQKLRETMKPAADPEAAFFTEWAKIFGTEKPETARLLADDMRESRARLQVRFNHWFDADPESAIARLGEIFAQGVRLFLAQGMGHIIDQHGVLESVRWAKHLPVSDHLHWLYSFQGRLDEPAIREQTLELILAPDASFTLANDRTRLTKLLAAAWPAAERDRLIRALPEEQRENAAMSLLAKLEPEEGAAWVDSLKTGGIVSDTSGLEQRLGSLRLQKARSLDEKLALLEYAGVAAPHAENYKKGEISRTIQAFLSGRDDPFRPANDSEEGDWLFAFRHGEVSAGEVLEAALASGPDPGGMYDEFRSQLYRHLAEDSPEAAATLYTDASEAHLGWQQSYAMRWCFSGIDPDRTLEFTRSIPHQEIPGLQENLREGWKAKSIGNLGRFGEDYIRWVRDLPASPERAWAVEGLHEAALRHHPQYLEQVKAMEEASR